IWTKMPESGRLDCRCPRLEDKGEADNLSPLPEIQSRKRNARFPPEPPTKVPTYSAKRPVRVPPQDVKCALPWSRGPSHAIQDPEDPCRALGFGLGRRFLREKQLTRRGVLMKK